MRAQSITQKREWEANRRNERASTIDSNADNVVALNETEFIALEKDVDFYFINNTLTYIDTYSSQSNETDLRRAVENSLLMGAPKRMNADWVNCAQRSRLIWWEQNVRRPKRSAKGQSTTHIVERRVIVQDNFFNFKTLAVHTQGRGWYDDMRELMSFTLLFLLCWLFAFSSSRLSFRIKLNAQHISYSIF